MFYPCDYEVKKTKEQEIRERVHEAEVDRLLDEIRPRHQNWVLRGTLHALRQMFGSLGQFWNLGNVNPKVQLHTK